MDIRQRIYEAISGGAAANMRSAEIFRLLNVTPDRKKNARRALDSLCEEAKVVRNPDGTYATPEQLGAFKGTVLANANGFAFVRPDDGGKDFFVPKRRLLEALDRDVRKPNENPSVGLILCTGKDDTVVEYALSRSLSPAMVADYTLHLPDKKKLQEKMREIAEISAEEL